MSLQKGTNARVPGRKGHSPLRRLRPRSGALLLSLIAIACWIAAHRSSLEAQSVNGGIISGQVVDPRGVPQRTLVHLLAPGDVPVGDMYTDSNGIFSFRGLPNGTYYLVVQVQGFRPYRESVEIDERLFPKAQVHVSLDPEEKNSGSPGPIIPGSASSYRLDLKKPGRSFDPKALREFDKGNEKQRSGDFPSAIAHYQKSLQIQADFYPALNNLGAVYLRRKQPAQAEAAFLKSLEIDPDDGEAYINLGHLFYEQGKYPRAAERLEEGVKRSPDSAVGHFLLGSTYLKLGELERAEVHLKKAVTVDSAGMPSARLQLANLYLKRRDPDAAKVELQAYLKANPSDPQAPAIKKLLANLEPHPAQ